MIHETIDGWSRVENLSDGYQGWAEGKMCTTLSSPEFEELSTGPKRVVATPVAGCQTHEAETFLLGMGSLLYPESETLGRLFSVEPQYLTDDTPAVDPTVIVQTAYSLLRAPYLWGGKTIMGIDCSGLTQLCFFVNGIQLPRDAKDQAQSGQPVAVLDEAQPGDLAFFASPEGKVTHVGILLSENRIIHASERVRIDAINETGIINVETQTQTHQLHSIRRLI